MNNHEQSSGSRFIGRLSVALKCHLTDAFPIRTSDCKGMLTNNPFVFALAFSFARDLWFIFHHMVRCISVSSGLRCALEYTH
jgi:hypothetical protein